MSKLMPGMIAWEKFWHPERFNIRVLRIITKDGQKKFEDPGRCAFEDGWLHVQPDPDNYRDGWMFNTDFIKQIEVKRT